MMIFFSASAMAEPSFQTLLLKDDGTFPNNGKLPLIFTKQAFGPDMGNLAASVEETFHENGWGSSWRNGLYDFHHYHSTAHEALGLYSGWVRAQFGGPGGDVVTAAAGDVIIVPAGAVRRVK